MAGSTAAIPLPLPARWWLVTGSTGHQQNPTRPRSSTMYDMSPEWGPAKNNPESPSSQWAVQQALDLRDNGGQRPDDN